MDVKTPVIEPDGNTGQIHLVGVRTSIGQRIFLPGLDREEITALRDALTAHLEPPVPGHAQHTVDGPPGCGTCQWIRDQRHAEHTVDGPQECPRCCLLRENAHWMNPLRESPHVRTAGRCPDSKICTEPGCGFGPCRRPGIPSQP